MILKKLVLFSMITLSFLIITSCSNSISLNLKKQTNESNNSNLKYSHVLSRTLDNTLNEKLYYKGISGYGHILTVRNVENLNNNSKLTISMEGIINNGIELKDSNDNERKFTIDYIVDNDSIVENIHNDLKNKEELKCSIIPNKIILKQPLAVDTKWSEKFNYSDGKEYEAISSITNIELSKDNGEIHPIYTVETIVNNIQYYEGNTYKEIRKIKEGKGIIEFTQSIPIYKDEEGSVQIPTFDFNYKLSENDK